MIQQLLGLILITLLIILVIGLTTIISMLTYEGYKSVTNKNANTGNKLINLTASGKQYSALCIWEEYHISHIFQCIHMMINRPNDLYCPKSENFKIKHEKSTIIIFGIITNQQLPVLGEQIRKQLFDIYSDRTHKGGTVNVV